MCCICAHKQRAGQLLDVHKVYDKVTKAITKQMRTRPRAYFVASHWEIMRNASLTASMRHLPLDNFSLSSELFFPTVSRSGFKGHSA